MKLRNKKTGAIYSIEDIDLGNNKDGIWLGLTRYNSLAELNEEWEDYKEPKEYWFIDYDGGIVPFNRNKETAIDNLMKQIGNYFETREEAEKAVEKLKAWKRVKRDLVSLNWQRERDGSFSVWGEFKTGNTLRADVYLDIHSKDLDLLFGGEE